MNYTLIWQEEGRYFWDDDAGEGFYATNGINLEYFAHDERSLFLKRYAELTIRPGIRDIHILADGLNISECSDLAQVDAEIHRDLTPYLEQAKIERDERNRLEKEARAEAARQKARLIEQQQRERDIALLRELQKKLGIIK